MWQTSELSTVRKMKLRFRNFWLSLRKEKSLYDIDILQIVLPEVHLVSQPKAYSSLQIIRDTESHLTPRPVRPSGVSKQRLISAAQGGRRDLEEFRHHLRCG